MQRSKTYRATAESFDIDTLYPPREAIKLARAGSKKKFDETLDVAMRLGVDPRKADQMVRGTVNLPHGTGKELRVAVLCQVLRCACSGAVGWQAEVHNVLLSPAEMHGEDRAECSQQLFGGSEVTARQHLNGDDGTCRVVLLRLDGGLVPHVLVKAFAWPWHHHSVCGADPGVQLTAGESHSAVQLRGTS